MSPEFAHCSTDSPLSSVVSKPEELLWLLNSQLLCVANICNRVLGAETSRLVACTHNAQILQW